jgi:basic amino acid/polyamine antiporter, APA family
VFIVPGLFVLKLDNYTPFFTHGAGGFATSLLPLFFAYAGFESICQTAGEVKDSKRRLPGILVRGITITALIYIFTSIVAFGVVAGGQLGKGAQIATVAAAYLPPSAALFVTLGAIAAFMTALNGTILVPSRLALTLVEDGLAPRWLGTVNEKTRVPIVGLTLTMLCCAILLVSGQISLALNIAVFALIMLYFIHSLVFLFLPRWNPALASEIKIDLSPRVRQLVTVVSLVSMGAMILIQLLRDVEVLRTSTLAQRIAERSLTSIELVFVWGIIGLVLYQLARMQRRNTVAKADAHGD